MPNDTSYSARRALARAAAGAGGAPASLLMLSLYFDKCLNAMERSNRALSEFNPRPAGNRPAARRNPVMQPQ